MKILSKLMFLFAVAALFFAQTAAVAAAQDAESKKERPNAEAENDFPPPYVMLEIKTEETTAETGQDIKVTVTITNTSDHDIFYDGYGHRRAFGLEVRDEMGRDVAKTPEGLRAGGSNGSVWAVPLHPGESIHGSARVNKEFELDKPGKYTVQATRPVTRTTSAKSNTITVTIIP